MVCAFTGHKWHERISFTDSHTVSICIKSSPWSLPWHLLHPILTSLLFSPSPTGLGTHSTILPFCSHALYDLPSISTHTCISDRCSALSLTHPGSGRQSFLKLPSDNPQIPKVLSLQWFFFSTALDRTLVQALAPNSYKSIMACYLLSMWFGPTETTAGLLKTHPKS